MVCPLMASVYKAFDFKVRLGYTSGAVLQLRVHAPDRAHAWERVRQMHPRAVEALRPAKPAAAEPAVGVLSEPRQATD